MIIATDRTAVVLWDASTCRSGVDAPRDELVLGEQTGPPLWIQQHDGAQPRQALQRQLRRSRRRFQPRQRRGQPGGVVDVIGDRTGGHDHLQIAILDDVAELSRSQAGVDRHDRAAEQRDAEQQLDELDRVGHEHAHVAARADPERRQASSGGDRSGGQLGIRQPALVEDQRLGVGTTLLGAQQQVGEPNHLLPVRAATLHRSGLLAVVGFRSQAARGGNARGRRVRPRRIRSRRRRRP